ncbi:MAG: 4Fe-4S binding protein [Bacteroidaceae bacterium]|nr:4Fe-4S binding protein [Bacteroidaceae bacterium]
MLKKIRITLAILFWVLITWLLVDFTGTAHAYLGWMAKIQLLPALLAVNVGALIFIVGLTLLFGRIYCSVICPLGVMQDAIAWLRRKKNKYSYSPAKNTLRYGVLAASGLALALNLGWLVALVAPYSTYGRIVGSVVAPLYKWGNNLLAQLAEHYGSYAFYEVDVWLKSGLTLGIVVVVWAVIAVLAWRGGRTWCNTICPVGTLLGLLSRNAWLKPVIDKEKCISCRKCERNCKAAAIDVKGGQEIDYSRCVVCGNCLELCDKDALHYTHVDLKPLAPSKEKVEKVVKAEKTEKNEAVDQGRRAALASAALLMGVGMLRAQEKEEGTEEITDDKTTDGGFAEIIDKKAPKREKRITPPGSLSARNLQSHCTACQLCVDSCPNDVLRPSKKLDRLMQPEVSYERGYCRPECNRCSQVCPTGAILPVTIEQRTAIQVGHAVWNRETCVPVKDGRPCGLCSRKCPAGAIQMVPLQSGVHQDGWRWVDADGKEIPREKLLMIPVVNEEKCIGCGACENLCPSRPYSAIYVEGHEVHREI